MLFIGGYCYDIAVEGAKWPNRGIKVVTKVLKTFLGVFLFSFFWQKNGINSSSEDEILLSNVIEKRAGKV